MAQTIRIARELDASATVPATPLGATRGPGICNAYDAVISPGCGSLIDH